MEQVILVPGRSAGGMVRRIHRNASVACCIDSFVVGPLCPVDDEARFTALRDSFWTAFLGDQNRFGPEEAFSVWETAFSVMPRFRDRIPGVERFEIWVGSDVHDTAFSVFAPICLNSLGVTPSQISLRYYHSERGFGLGVMNEGELRTRGQVTELDVAEIDRRKSVWTAFCVVSTGKLDIVASNATEPEAEVLRVLKGRWPDPRTGLSNLQRYLLQDASDTQRKAAHFVARAMGRAMDEGDYVGDLVLFEELKRMGTLLMVCHALRFSGWARTCGPQKRF